MVLPRFFPSSMSRETSCCRPVKTSLLTANEAFGDIGQPNRNIHNVSRSFPESTRKEDIVSLNRSTVSSTEKLGALCGKDA